MNSRTKKIRDIVKSLENNDEFQSQSNQKQNFTRTTTQSQRNICSKTSLDKHRLDDELTADWPLPKQSEYANSFDLVHQYDFTKLMQPLVSPEDLQLDHETSTTQQCPDQPEIRQLTELTTVQITDFQNRSPGIETSQVIFNDLLLSDDLFPSSPQEFTPPDAASRNSLELSELLSTNSDDSVKDRDYVPSPTTAPSSLDSSTENLATFTEVSQEGSSVPLAISNKRKCLSGKQKIIKKRKENIQKYGIKPACNNLCKKLCTLHFTEDERQSIHTKYWSLDWEARGVFVKGLVEVKECEIRSTKKTPKRKRSITYHYFFMNNDQKIEVCKTFFLCTLGYNKKNDTRILTILKKDLSDQKDKRDGRNLQIVAHDKDLLTEHVNSFNPCVHHYRRSHAPKKRYLPSDLSITAMYENFSDLHPDKKCCFETYRKHVTNTMNISFARLGHEECEICETFQLHNTEHVREMQNSDCEHCSEYLKHREKYTKARKTYDTDAKIVPSEKHVYVSADLQKVIMLPRIDAFKSALFCPRIVAYNETFVPLGKYTSSNKAYAVIWHEAVSGRKQEDITSTFRAFLMSRRDAETVTIWLDNCSAQNKNWCLLTYLIYVVNSVDIAALKIVLKYFEPGHTFMSADSFHHNVEQSLQKVQKVYDFGDFTRAVEGASTGKVLVKSMGLSDFYVFKSHIAQQKLRDGQGNRVYLKDIVEVIVQRGQYCLFYKKDFDSEEYEKLACLKSKKIPDAPVRCVPQGVAAKRKQDLIKKLGPLMPKNRIGFWKQLPVTSGPDERVDFEFENSDEDI